MNNEYTLHIHSFWHLAFNINNQQQSKHHTMYEQNETQEKKIQNSKTSWSIHISRDMIDVRSFVGNIHNE